MALGSFAVSCTLCALFSVRAEAQVPDVLRERPTAYVAAFGGAGAGAIGLLDARWINPALLAADVPATFEVGLFKSTVTDITGARLGVSGRLRRFGRFSLDVRRRQIDDLLDDSTLAATPGLEVSDWGLQLGYARGLMGGRLHIGASWETLSSRVFGTTGGGWTADVGAAAEITSNVSIGITLAHLGPRYAWRDALGGDSYSPQGRTIVGGVRWSFGQARRVGVQVAGDVVRAVEAAAEEGMRIGGEVMLLRHVALRGGYARMQDANDSARGMASAGLGLRIRNVRIDIARDRLGSVVGERTLVDFSIHR